MVYLLRHGRDDEEFLGGWSDNALTDEGREQIKNAALNILKSGIKINKIISSPIRRARESAEIVANILGIENIEVNDFLKEQNKGLLNGMNKKEANIKYPEYLITSIDTIYPEGESLRQLYNRIVTNLDYFYGLEDGTLLITHRGVINMLYYYLNDVLLDMNKKQFHVNFASLHELDKDNKTIKKIF